MHDHGRLGRKGIVTIFAALLAAVAGAQSEPLWEPEHQDLWIDAAATDRAEPPEREDAAEMAAATADHARDSFDVRGLGPIVALAEAASDLKRGRLSGVFVADTTGILFYHGSDPSSDQPLVTHLKPIDRFFAPKELAYAEPSLYVYDGKTQSIWTIDMGGEQTRRTPRSFGIRPTEPSHLAASTRGLVALTEGSRLVFLQEGRAATFYERSSFPDPIDLAFSSWDTLHVLDRSRRSLVTITLRRLSDGTLEFASETEAPAEWLSKEWRAMTVGTGTVYVADDRQVYAYLPADGTLIPVLPERRDQTGISDLAVTFDDIYLVRDGRLERHAKNEPVDVTLEGLPETNRGTLLALHVYLAEKDLLPTGEREASTDYRSLEEFLQAVEVLPWGADDSQGRPIRLYAAGATQPLRWSTEPSSRAEIQSRWERLICLLNEPLCAGSGTTALRAKIHRGQRLRVPDLKISRRLGQARVLLMDQSLGDVVQHLVFAPELARKGSGELLVRLNPRLRGMDESEVLRLSRGFFVVPIEQWTVTAAVPSADLQDPSSPLRELEREFPGTSIYSRRAFGEQTSDASLLQDPPAPDPAAAPMQDPPVPDPAADRCARLRAKRAEWLEDIDFSLGRQGDRRLLPNVLTEVRLGILEKPTTLLTGHQVFSLHRDYPTWHSAADFELVAQPDPATFQPGSQVVDDLETYSVDAHHGTHVSALIGGRAGDCWGGLLPRARLSLVPTDDAGALRRRIVDAVYALVEVFNVSQAFEGPQTELKDTIRDFTRNALFVAAAGNAVEANDLDRRDEARVPAPARWGAAANVVTVTAADTNGVILPVIQTPDGIQQGANFGKRYVDLVAVGASITSASEQNRYGPATGTSQAAPQVAAAAALLVDDDGARLAPGDAKARLIATADWNPSFEGKVWGGSLDFGAAVAFPDRNILKTTTGNARGLVYSFRPQNDPHIVLANAPRYYDRQGGGSIAPRKMPFSHILSLKRQPNGNYRVVLREPTTNHLKIILDAQLQDPERPVGGPIRIRCGGLEVWDYTTGIFTPSNDYPDGLSVTQIEEYIQRAPYGIVWEELL